MFLIARWNETFEDSRSRKLVDLKYLQMPMGLNSNGYINLMAQGAAGLMAYGTFQAICQLSAARRPEHRGKVCRSDGSPLSEKQLASHLRIPRDDLSTALELLKSPEIAWIIEVEDDERPPTCQPSASNPPPATQSTSCKTNKLTKSNKTTNQQTTDRQIDGGVDGQASLSVGRSSGVAEILRQLRELDAKAVERDCSRIREVSGVSKERLSGILVTELAFLSRWKDRDMFRGVARRAGDRECDSPSKYVVAAIRNKCNEHKVDPVSFSHAVGELVTSLKGD